MVRRLTPYNPGENGIDIISEAIKKREHTISEKVESKREEFVISISSQEPCARSYSTSTPYSVPI